MPTSRFSSLAALTMTACAQAAPAIGAVVQLTEHQSATVAAGAVLTYDSVEDSRCPPDVHCIVAGKVLYHFTLQQGDTREQFTLTPAAPAFASRALDGKRIMLADTAPPPRAGLAAAPHPVSIKVVAP